MQLVATVLDSTMLESYHIYSSDIYFFSKRRLCMKNQYLGLRAKGWMD